MSSTRKTKYHALSGAEAAAEAMRQINPDVVAVYPITPQTPIIESFARMAADGKVTTSIINAESEHSALSAVVGASAAGVRAMTATSSQGLAFMAEVCYIASGMRLPIVMAVANRSLSAPLNIHGDQSDAMMLRDSGWIQIFSENAQEVYDNTLISLRLAEHGKVLTPVMVMQDGFITSHAVQNVLKIEDKIVKKFIGEWKPLYPLLDVDHPVTYGGLDLFDYYFEHKRQQIEGIENVLNVLRIIDDEYEKLSGRKYSYIEEYRLKDASIAVVLMGSTAGTAKVIVDKLRKKGIKAGLLKIRLFRPFPGESIRRSLAKIKRVAILDKAAAPGAYGALSNEIRALYAGAKKTPKFQSCIYGLGGRDVSLEDVGKIYADLQKGKIDNKIKYIGLR
ncbi:MAG: transketolase C-terminal domain-containing protein [bacterium]|nr:transketolase C-terminal domain-containing protein [bacterium]